MPANIEIKARARNFADLRRGAEELSDTPAQVVPQEDDQFEGELQEGSHGRESLS